MTTMLDINSSDSLTVGTHNLKRKEVREIAKRFNVEYRELKLDNGESFLVATVKIGSTTLNFFSTYFSVPETLE